MANQKHLDLLKQGVEVWNTWRKEYPDIRPGLRGADLRGADLRGADLRRATLRGADLGGAILIKATLQEATLIEADLRGATLLGARLTKADLRGADLVEATLIEADLGGARLIEADLLGAYLTKATLLGAYLTKATLLGARLTKATLIEADLGGADLGGADLGGADLRRANLKQANLVETNLEQAVLIGCSIYGLSVWGVHGTPKAQSNLVITSNYEPTVTVDNLKIAQFIYLLLNNAEIREVIDTIGKKAVLILGRFTKERKAVLDALREELRHRDYLPILFDFEKPGSRDLTETISTLAHLSRFIIADITDAKSIPQELQAIVPNLPSVAVRPIILQTEYEYGMFEHFQRFPWVLPVYRYADVAHLLATLAEQVILPAEAKVKELAPPPR